MRSLEKNHIRMSSIFTSIQTMLSLAIFILMMGFHSANARSHGDVRLEGGSTVSEGRVEIWRNGLWGTVCRNSWDDEDASVVCRQLGFGGHGIAVDSATFGEGSGRIWLDNVICDGSEERLEWCDSLCWGHVTCSTHGEDAAVKCIGVRLVGRNRPPNEGTVQIFMNGLWGTINKNSTDESTAIVGCRELGYSDGKLLTQKANVKALRTGPIWMNKVHCNGDETKLLDCAHKTNTSLGSHQEDVDVVCLVNIRLVDGYSHSAGRIEVLVSDEWGTINDASWDDNDASVACRQLGYHHGGVAYTATYFGKGIGPIWFTDFNCVGNENGLLSCPHSTNTSWKTHARDASLICNGSVRLVDGEKASDGRVAIFLNGTWGTVSNTSWNNKAADIVCRQLGYLYGGVAKTVTHIGQKGNGNRLSDVTCVGTETNLLDCLHKNDRDVDQTSDASVSCHLTECITGWQNMDEGSSYCYYSTRKPWHSASQFCSDINGHLIWIESERENDFVTTSVISEKPGGRIWIGLNDLEEEGNWKLDGGESTAPSTFTNWRNNEPNDYKEEDCAMIYGAKRVIKGRWNDLSCKTRLPFVCEIN